MDNLKELIVVLGISIIGFAWLKPIILQFTAEADYGRRRNLWLVLTCIGFLSPNIWVYAVLAAPLMIWGARKDSNPSRALSGIAAGDSSAIGSDPVPGDQLSL